MQNVDVEFLKQFVHLHIDKVVYIVVDKRYQQEGNFFDMNQRLKPMKKIRQTFVQKSVHTLSTRIM